MNEPWMWHSWGMGVGMLFMFVPWVLTIVGLVFFFKWVLNQLSARQGGLPVESALDILKKRYARGEINKEEYEEKKNDLL